MNLSKYFLNNISIYNIPCAAVGRYDLLVASEANAEINVNISKQKPFLARKLSQYVQTSRIRYENRIQKRQTLFRWDKRYSNTLFIRMNFCFILSFWIFFCENSKLDIHVMQYCLAINIHSNQETLCNAIDTVIGKSPKTFCTRLKTTLDNYFLRPVERILNIGEKFFLQIVQVFKINVEKRLVTSLLDSKRGTALACTGLRNKQTLVGLVSNTKYFVDVFGVHMKVPGLIFKIASTSFVFNTSNPIELHEDQMEIGRLSTFDERSVFIFKVNRQNITVQSHCS